MQQHPEQPFGGSQPWVAVLALEHDHLLTQCKVSISKLGRERNSRMWAELLAVSMF